MICPICNGRGMILDGDGRLVTCYACGGRGEG